MKNNNNHFALRIGTGLAAAAAGIACCISSANAAIVFRDNFEPTTSGSNATSLLGAGTTANVTTYTVGNTSGSVNTTLWVKSAQGYGASRSGLVDESENSGLNFTDTTGPRLMQAATPRIPAYLRLPARSGS